MRTSLNKIFTIGDNLLHRKTKLWERPEQQEVPKEFLLGTILPHTALCSQLMHRAISLCTYQFYIFNQVSACWDGLIVVLKLLNFFLAFFTFSCLSWQCTDAYNCCSALSKNLKFELVLRKGPKSCCCCCCSQEPFLDQVSSGPCFGQ